MEEEIKKDRNSEALKLGVLLGLIMVLNSVLFYIIDVTLLGDWKMSLIVFSITLGLISYRGRKFRDEEHGGFISFKQAYLFSFIACIVSSVIGLIYGILLYEVIDPDLPKILTDVALENMEKMWRGFGMSDEKIDEMLPQMEAEMAGQFSAMGIIKNSWVYLIGSAFISLITGLIIKKSQPDFE